MAGARFRAPLHTLHFLLHTLHFTVHIPHSVKCGYGTKRYQPQLGASALKAKQIEDDDVVVQKEHEMVSGGAHACPGRKIFNHVLRIRQSLKYANHAVEELKVT